jgi:hypothetical protein
MMYKESDYEGGISFAARVAWMIAAWIALMLLMIVLSGPSNRVADPVPQKKIVNQRASLLSRRGRERTRRHTSATSRSSLRWAGPRTSV